MSKRKKRKDGRVEMKITIGRDINGKPIRKAFYGATERECKAKIKAYWQGEYKPTYSDITLAEWADKWLETYKAGKVKYSTLITTYQNPVNNHIKPYFKQARLKDIRRVDIERFLQSKANLSEATLHKIKLTLRGIFESAVENDIIPKNPAKSIKPVSNAPKKEKRAYSLEEARQFISFCKTHPDGLAPIIMIKAGLRRGELLALKWSDIDFKEMTIDVNKAVKKTASGYAIGEPKNEASKAAVPFDDELKELLLASRGIGFVFGKNGTFYDPDSWHKNVYKKLMLDYAEWCAENGKECRLLNPHELRHTCGSLVYKATRDIFITSKIMRHSDVQTTAKIYVHEDLETKREAILATFG